MQYRIDCDLCRIWSRFHSMEKNLVKNVLSLIFDMNKNRSLSHLMVSKIAVKGCRKRAYSREWDHSGTVWKIAKGRGITRIAARACFTLERNSMGGEPMCCACDWRAGMLVVSFLPRFSRAWISNPPSPLNTWHEGQGIH